MLCYCPVTRLLVHSLAVFLALFLFVFLHRYHATVLSREGNISFRYHAVSLTAIFHHGAASSIITTLSRYRFIQLQRHCAVESVLCGQRRGFPPRSTLAILIQEALATGGRYKEFTAPCDSSVSSPCPKDEDHFGPKPEAPRVLRAAIGWQRDRWPPRSRTARAWRVACSL